MPTLLPLAFALMTWADPPAPSPLAPADVVAALETALEDAIALAEPSIVAIAREKSERDETTAVRGLGPPPPDPNLFPRGFDRRMGGLTLDPGNADMLTFDFGSGVVVGDEGEILTAFHVVKGAARLIVRAADRQGFDAEIIAADPRSDLAVIAPRLRPELGRKPRLTPIKLGRAESLRKGAFLVALGNPFNAARDGKPSASWGILSNLARRIEPAMDDPSRQDFSLRNYPTLLQLDSKLNLGMSGGAVINFKGELVGLTTAAANAGGFDAQAGYAIPMDALGRNVVEALRQGKEYEHGFLGISLDTVSGTNRVVAASAGSPAAEGGVQVNDLIVGVGEHVVTDADSLVVAINSVPAGQSVTLKLLRGGTPLERTVELAKRKVPGVIATNLPAPWRGLRVDFTSTLSHTTFPPELFDAMAKRGVVVTEVEPHSPAEAAGLRPGRIITRVEGQPVPTPRDFARAVEGLTGPATLETDGGTVTLKPPTRSPARGPVPVPGPAPQP
ncbi:MAG: trypsin-like peptidase domain-containing protein [Isosphaeraceae bacterium]